MGMDVIGRLKPEVNLERASTEMQALAGHLADQYPDVNKGTGVTLLPLEVGRRRIGQAAAAPAW